LVGRKRHDVGRMGEVATVAAHDVAERLAVGVSGAIVRRRRAQRGKRRRRRETRRAQRDLLEAWWRDRPWDRDAEARCQQLADARLLLGGRTLVLVSPTPELAAARHGRRTNPWPRSRQDAVRMLSSGHENLRQLRTESACAPHVPAREGA